MKRTVALASLLLLAPVVPWAQENPKALAHDVYFSLNDASPAARAEFARAKRALG